MKKTWLLVIIMMLPLMFSCNRKINADNEYDHLSKISQEDFETIDYVNTNSNLEVEFMKKLGDNVQVEPQFYDTGESNYFEYSSNRMVMGVGHYIPELKGKYLSRVRIRDNDIKSENKADILGVEIGDKYSDAIKKLEEHGFTLYMDDPRYKVVVCNKGRIGVEFYYESDINSVKEDYKIYSLSVEFMYKVSDDLPKGAMP